MTHDGCLLLVEDNPGDAGLTRSLVDDAFPVDAPEVRWVQTVDAALRVLHDVPDTMVVLLDLGLPGCLGLDALHAIAPYATECPVIVLTGEGDDALGAAAVDAGAQDFLVKGAFDADQLRRRIRFATRRKRAERREIDRNRQAALDDAVAARNLMHDVLARVSDGFLALDRDWRYTYVNPQALRLMRHATAGDVVGRSLWDEYPELSASPIGAKLRDAAATQRPAVFDLYYRPWTRWFEVRAHPGPEGISLYFSDITDRRAAEKAILDFRDELSRLARRLLEQERTTTQRVAQALHDRLGQTLAIARLEAEALVAECVPAQSAGLAHRSGRIAMHLDRAILEVRQVLIDLRPPHLEDDGLLAALDDEIKAHDRGAAGPDVLIEADDAVGACRWPAEVEYAAFMVAREAIANALQHANATLVRVLVGGDAGALTLEVVDDGCGIAPELIRGRPGHLGVVGMRERAIAIGACFEIASSPEGGTRATLRWTAPAP